MSLLEFEEYEKRYVYSFDPLITRRIYETLNSGIDDCPCFACHTFSSNLERVIPCDIRLKLASHGVDWRMPCYLHAPDDGDKWLYGVVYYECVGSRRLRTGTGPENAWSPVDWEYAQIQYDAGEGFPPGAVRSAFHGLNWIACEYWLDEALMDQVAAPCRNE